MNMTDQDWEIVLAEQQEAFQALCSKKEKYDPYRMVVTVNDEPVKPSDRNQIFEYIRVERKTAKAKFFVTHETLGEIHGFWCPDAAIVSRDSRYIEIQHWCKIKIINFV